MEDKHLSQRTELLKEMRWRLMVLSRRLKVLSVLIIVSFFGSVSWLCYLVFREANKGYFRSNVIPPYGYRFFASYDLLPIFLGVAAGILLLFLFDWTRKQGLVDYDLVSDETEKYYRDSSTYLMDAGLELDLRRTIRKFIRATDLPFSPGGVGQILYLLLFLFVIIATLVLFVVVA